ncbi:cellulose synthase operon protein C [Gammaproteobacteria bacterium]
MRSSQKKIEAARRHCQELQIQERFEAAIDAYRQNLIDIPDDLILLLGLGRTLVTLNRLEEALSGYEEILRRFPDNVEVWGQYGEVLRRLNRFDESLLAFNHALGLQPENFYLRWQRSFTRLALGDLTGGWEDYEGRRYNWLPLPFLEWQGESLRDQTLLVLAEQGLGDELLFASCLHDLMEKTKKLIIECDPRLASLYTRSFPLATIKGVIRSDRAWLNSLGKVDKVVALGSLPRFLRRHLSDFPEHAAYLDPAPERKEFWRQRLAALGSGYKIGICWRSQLLGQGRHINYSQLEKDWGDVLKIKGVHFVNLQYDDCQVELATSERHWGIPINQFHDLDLKNQLDDLAALCASLDLIISAGTAVAELAAAVGIEVWRLETVQTNWVCLGTQRWPWHPRVRLFVQSSAGEWQTIFSHLAEELTRQVNQKTWQAVIPKSAPLSSSLHSKESLRQALSLHEVGTWDEAEKLYLDYLTEHPDDPIALYYLGTLKCQKNQPGQALNYLERLLVIQPEHAQGLNNRGLALAYLERWTEAEQCYRRVLDLQPEYAHAWNNLGGVLEHQGLFEAAFEVYETALKFKPDYPEAWYNLGRACYHLERYQEAEYQFSRILAKYPRDVKSLNYLGAVYKLQDKAEQAIIYLQTAITIEPYNLDPLNNLAAIYQQMNRFSEALECYDRALAVSQDPQVRFNRSIVLLALGRLGEGWDEYQSRKELNPTPKFSIPIWQGEPLAGKTLFIHGEQGIGDEIWFASCLDDVIQRVKRCVIQCDPRLAPLLSRSFPTALIKGIPSLNMQIDVDRLENFPPLDYVCAMGDLPRWFRRELVDFPKKTAYLIPDANEVAIWRERLNHIGPGIKIGICWRSGNSGEGRHRHYSRLDEWQPLLTMANVIFINLQYDDCHAELATARMMYGVEIVQFSDLDLKNQLDRVAALCQALDGVISAPTAVAELAGAVGTPVWRLDSLEMHWGTFGTGQWLWHPKTRIVSQQQRNDWQTPLSQIAQDLADSLSIATRLDKIADASLQEEITFHLPATSVLSTSGRTLVDQALLHYRKGELQQAEILLDKYLQHHGEDAEVYEIKGMIALSSDQFTDAERNFQKALLLNPKLTFVYARLATAQAKLNHLDQAEESYRQGIQVAPKFAALHNDLANLLWEQHRLEEAKAAYLQALRLKPDLVEAHNNLGAIFLEQDKPEEAIRTLHDALRLRPHFATAHHNLGRALARKNDLEGAIASYRQALLYDPTSAAVYKDLGDIEFQKGNYQNAVIQYRKSVELLTDFVPARINLACALIKTQSVNEAIELLQQALSCEPDNHQVHANLGHALFLKDELEEAEFHCREALRLHPDFPDALINLTLVLQIRGKLAEAENLCREALHSYPNNIALHTNLRRALYEQNRLVDALVVMDKILLTDQDNAGFHWDRSLPLLTMGEIEAGWEAYEWGRKMDDRRRSFTYPDWDGTTTVEGTLLIYAEQGLGDELMFASCIPDVLKRVDHYVIECDPRLATLYARSFPGAVIHGVKRNDRAWLEMENIAAQIPVGSLAFIFRRHLQDFPDRPAYLLANPERVVYWKDKVQSLGEGLKIGICWRSGLMKGSRPLYYSSLEQWGDIFAVPGVHFINLQYGRCEEELTAARLQFGVTITVFDEIDLMNDLDEAAALSASVDLVIGAGTAALEIAAGLGVPIWRIDSTHPAWTSLGTDSMPWHPRMQIFRQVTWGDWREPLSQVATILKNISANVESAKQRLQSSIPLVLNEHAQLENMRYQFILGNWSKVESLGAHWCLAHEATYTILDMLGITALRQGETMAARDYLTRALILSPDHAVAYYHLGLVLQAQRDFESARHHYHEALRLKPDFSLAHNNLGNVFLELDNNEQAEVHYREALRINPEESKTYNNLAVLLKKQDRIDEAIDLYRRALRLNSSTDQEDSPRYLPGTVWQPLVLNPVPYEIHANLGNALLDRGDLEEAELHYRKALDACPDHITILNGLADSLREQGRLEEALNYHQRAVDIGPERADVHWNHCLTQLMHGDLDAGWQGYEWRFHALEQRRAFPWPEWDGTALPNERLFIYAEQGVGDEILFASCFSDIIDQVGHCVIECDPRLSPLYARSFPRATVRGQMRRDMNWTQEIEPISAQIPIGSLPFYVRRQLDYFPRRAAYLHADPERVVAWRQRLTKTVGSGLCIGIIWRSGVLLGRRRLRYSPLEQWGSILKTPHIHFINLQYDECQEELNNARRHHGVEIIEFPELDLRDNLDELAALLTALDGVIGAGTATSALAAALGTPVWRLDPFLPAWISLGTDYLPWFPCARIFKQPHWNDWGTPQRELAQALSIWAARHREHFGRSSPIQVDECSYGWFCHQPQDGAGLTWTDYIESLTPKIQFWQSLIKAGCVVIDVEAGIGDCAIPLGNIVGSTGMVIAFEPILDRFERLCTNITLNRLEHVKPYQQMLGSQSEMAPAAYHGADARLSQWDYQRQLTVVTINDLHLSRCDLIRIRCECREHEILSGAELILRQYKPFVYVEGFRGPAAAGWVRWLEGLGYQWLLRTDSLAGTQAKVTDLLAYPSV